jgi:hypothetical protein
MLNAMDERAGRRRSNSKDGAPKVGYTEDRGGIDMALLPELPARSGCLARGRVEPGGKQNENKAWGEAVFIHESLAAIHE